MVVGIIYSEVLGGSKRLLQLGEIHKSASSSTSCLSLSLTHKHTYAHTHTSSRVPLGGFSHLVGASGIQKFTITHAKYTPDILPSASTW